MQQLAGHADLDPGWPRARGPLGAGPALGRPARGQPRDRGGIDRDGVGVGVAGAGQRPELGGVADERGHGRGDVRVGGAHPGVEQGVDQRALALVELADHEHRALGPVEAVALGGQPLDEVVAAAAPSLLQRGGEEAAGGVLGTSGRHRPGRRRLR